MTRYGSTLVLVAPAGVAVVAALGSVVLGLGIAEAIAVGAVVMVIGHLVRRSLTASPAGGSDR